MATAVHPFQAGTPALTFDAILNKRPVPAASLNACLAVELVNVIDKCLEKRREDRYASSSELLAELRRLKRQHESGHLELCGAPTQLSAAPLPPEVTAPSIAVLPFVNMSGDPQNEYFGDGLAEELINLLTRVAGLRVAARTSSFACKGRQQDIRTIGRQLNVKTLLEGSVRRAGNRLRVAAQLVNAADGYQLWSERYDRTLEDVFAIQDEIAQSIAQALQVVLTERDKQALAQKPTCNVQAYDYYLRGRQYLHQLRRRSLEFALQMFTRAIQIDPGYAPAHAGKADCHALLYMMWDRSDATLAQADEASRKAQELGPELAESHVARGLALYLASRFDEARQEFDTALHQNPQLFEAYYHYGRVCQRQGKPAEAARLFEQAARVDPDDYQALLQLGSVYQQLGRPAEGDGSSRLGLARAEEHLALHPDDARALALGAGNWCLLGETDRALDWANRALALDPDEPLTLYNVACVYALLKRVDEAVACLEKAVAKGYSAREWMRSDSDLAALHGQPRFEALVR
jgi:TolB-like protein